MLATGRNTFDHLIAKSNKRIDDETLLIDPPSPIDLDYNQLIDFSTGSKHTVYITSDGKAFAYGDDRTFIIGTKNRQIYQNPVQISFDNVADKFISAKCGQIYTVYLTEKGFIIICSEKSIHCVPAIHTFEYRIVYISGNYLSPVAIDARGDFYIFSKNPSSTPRHIHLQEPVYDICRCSVYVPANQSNTNKIVPNLHQPEFPNTNSIRSHLPPIRSQVETKITNANNNNNNEKTNNFKLKISFTAVVTVSGKLYANGTLNNNSSDFNEVYSMHGVHVKHIYGYSGHCIAISDDGHVYTVGDNTYGQIGDGTTDDRFEFVCLNDIKTPLSNEVAVSAAVGGSHSLVVTKSGKVFGFGSNEKNQLFTVHDKTNILTPVEINLDNYKKILSAKNDQKLFNFENQSEFDNKVTFAWCGNSCSIALIGKKPPLHLGFTHFFGGRESLAMQLRKISSSNIEYLEKQVNQLKQEVQSERDQKQQLLQEKQKLQEQVQSHTIITPSLTTGHYIHNDRMKKRMEMRLCDIFSENDKLAEQNVLKTREIDELKKENEKLRVENEILRNEVQKSISKSEYEKESNFRTSENAKLRKELEEKNVKIASLMNEKNIIITQPPVPHANGISPHHVSRSHSSTKTPILIKKPMLPNKK